MSKDEYDLIEDFILYYGYLFSYENIIIIDNESTNEDVLKIYEKYKKLGVNVYTESNYASNGQGNAFNKYMNMYKSKCDFMIGLDTDEFLYLCNSNDPCNKNDIINMFNNYDLNNTMFKINEYPCSVIDTSNENYVNQKIKYPARDIIYFSNELKHCEVNNTYWKNTPKFFFRSSAFINTSNGNHNGNVSYGDCILSSFGLLHFNSTGKRREYERALNVINGYSYFSTSQNINNQINMLVLYKKKFINGFHKVNLYHKFLLRMFIVELFIKYIKRLPLLDELEHLVEENFNNKTLIIENNFKTYNESVSEDNNNHIINDEQKNNIIFYDKPLDKNNDKVPIIKIDFISNVLKNI